MISSRILFAALSSVAGVACFVPYLRDVFLKKTTPHIYSWFVWTVLQTIGAAAMFKGGAGGAGVFSLTIGAALCGFVFLFSFWYGTKNITVFDRVCLLGALSAIVLWLFLHNPLLSVIVVTLIDLVAFLPTFRKGYVEPRSETVSTYALAGISQVFAFGALSEFSMTTMLYLMSLVVTNFVFVVMIFVRRS